MISKLLYYFKAFLVTAHFKFWLANLFCGLFPAYSSGAVRTRVYRLTGFKLERGCFIMGNLDLLGSQRNFYKNLEVGFDTLISTHITINLDDKVTIGNKVTLSPFVRIYTSTHEIGPASQRCKGEPIAKPVVIEDGSWIALGVTILPGVRIGRGSVVAAGAVVTKDLPPNSYAVGVPAKVIKTLPDE